MPEKPNAPKKKAKTSAPKRATKAAVSIPKSKAAAKGETTYYVTAPQFTVIVSESKPANSDDSRQYASFEGARRAAVDVLVQAIEEAESRLLTLRRTSSYAEWKSADKSE